MECPKKHCKGRMHVYRTVSGKGYATQERYCIVCGHSKTYTVLAHEDDIDARTLAKRIRDAKKKGAP